jgi:hypothetical protein
VTATDATGPSPPRRRNDPRERTLLEHQNARTVAERGTADALVLEALDHPPALALDVFRAHAHLIGDGGLVLSIRAESGIEGNSHGFLPPGTFTPQFFRK